MPGEASSSPPRFSPIPLSPPSAARQFRSPATFPSGPISGRGAAEGEKRQGQRGRLDGEVPTDAEKPPHPQEEKGSSGDTSSEKLPLWRRTGAPSNQRDGGNRPYPGNLRVPGGSGGPDGGAVGIPRSSCPGRARPVLPSIAASPGVRLRSCILPPTRTSADRGRPQTGPS